MRQIATHSLDSRRPSLALTAYNMWEVQADASYHSAREAGSMPDHWILIHTTAGQGYLSTWNRNQYALTASSTLLLPYQTIHRYGTQSGDDHANEWHFTWIEFQGPKDLGESLQFPTETVVLTAVTAQQHQHLLSLRECIPDPFNNAKAGTVLGMWLWELADAAKSMPSHNIHDSSTMLIKEACRTLDELEAGGGEANKTPSVERWADACGVSSRYLRQAFSKALGQSPKQFLEARALTRAMDRLLFTTDSLATIADTLGFSSAFHFSNRFKRHYGYPPSQVRKAPTQKS